MKKSRVPVYVIAGPTVIAFCPLTDRDMKVPGTVDAYEDYVYYTGGAAEPIRKMGVRFEPTAARSFFVKSDGKQVLYGNRERSCGYYFVMPGKAAHVEATVLTDDDLLQIARSYFGLR